MLRAEAEAEADASHEGRWRATVCRSDTCARTRSTITCPTEPRAVSSEQLGANWSALTRLEIGLQNWLGPARRPPCRQLCALSHKLESQSHRHTPCKCAFHESCACAACAWSMDVHAMSQSGASRLRLLVVDCRHMSASKYQTSQVGTLLGSLLAAGVVAGGCSAHAQLVAPAVRAALRGPLALRLGVGVLEILLGVVACSRFKGGGGV